MKRKDLKLLVLDDSKEFVFLLTGFLSFKEVQVETESDPLKALSMAETTKFDLIISDYLMDKMDGISFSEKIRGSQLNSETKIILLTAKHLENSEISKVNKLNLVYVSKPILPNDLYKKVMETIQN